MIALVSGGLPEAGDGVYPSGMTDVLSRDLPAPKNWQDFERLAFDVYRRLWRTSDAQLNGRSGQPQSGVDVYGTDRGEGRFVGVQCKGRDGGYRSALTEREVRDEVAKALTFQPPLDLFVIATTAPNDAAMQAVARSITQAHRTTGAFEVQVTGWDTFKQYVTDYPDVVAKHFGDLAPIDLVDAFRSQHRDSTARLGRIETQLAAQSRYLASRDPGGADDPFAQRITDAARLVGEGAPRTSLRLLTRLLEENEQTLSPLAQYRLLANMANAEFVLGREKEAVALFRRAYDAHPSYPNARASMALVDLFEGRRAEGLERAAAALRDDPGSERAAGVVIDATPDDVPTSAVASSLPSTMAASEQVELHLSLRATRLGEPTDALTHAERALELAPDSWRAKSAVAEALMHPFGEAEGVALTHAMTPEMTAAAERALTLSQSAWATLSAAESSHVGRHVAFNVMNLLELFGRDVEAEAAMEDGLGQNPDYAPLLRRKAQIAAARGSWRDALSVVDRMKPEEVIFDDLLVRTQAALRTGAAELAISSAAAMRDVAAGQEQIDYATALAVQARIVGGEDPTTARGAALDANPSSVILRSVTFDFVEEEDPLRDRIVSELETSAASEMTVRTRLHAAETLNAAGRHSLAADLYEPLHDLNDSIPLLRRLEALYRADRRAEARALFERLSPDLRESGRYAWIGVAIYERAGLLRPALQLAEAALRHNDVLHNRLGWIGLLRRQGRGAEAGPWLREVSDDMVGSPSELMTLARLIDDAAPGDARAASLGYRALRSGYADPDVHLAYAMGLFIEGGVGRAMPPPTTVEPGTGVVLRNVQTDEFRHFVIETAVDAAPERGELPARGPLGRRLIGLSQGDELEIERLGAEPDVYRVEEVQSRYVFAFQRTLREFSTLFPGHVAMGSVDIGEEGAENRFEAVFAAARERAKQARELQATYRDGIIPVFLISRFAGASPFDLWEAFAADPAGGLKVALGLEEEFTSGRVAAGGLAVVDPVTLNGWVRAGMTTALMPLRHRLAVVQSCIDMLRGQLFEWERKRGRRTGSFGFDGERYHMIEIAGDAIDARIALADEAVRFAEGLRLVPAEDARPLRPDVADLLANGHPAFRDTLLAARAVGRSVLTDDLAFRAIVVEAGASATWTQAFLQRWTGHEGGERNRYRSAVHAMLSAGYDFVQFGHLEILEDLRETNWNVDAGLNAFVDRLARPTINRSSLVLVLAQLLLSSVREAPSDAAFAAFINAVADRIRTRAGEVEVEDLLHAVFVRLVDLLVLQLNRVRLRRQLLATSHLVPAGLSAISHVPSADAFARSVWKRLAAGGLALREPSAPRMTLPPWVIEAVDANGRSGRTDRRRRGGN